MKQSPIEPRQFFTYEKQEYPQAVLATPQLVQSEAGLLGSLASADRPPSPPELRVPNWGASVAQSLGQLGNTIASIPQRKLALEEGQVALEKAQAELPAQKEAARTDYMKQVSVNQAYINDVTKNHPELLPYIIQSKETGLGPLPYLNSPGAAAAGQNPILPSSSDPRIPVPQTQPTTDQSVPTGTPVRQALPAQSSTDVPTNDPRVTSAMIAAQGTPLTAAAGEEGSISTDTGASPAAAELKQSTAIAPPQPPNGDEVAKAYGQQIAPVSGWHREVNPDGSLGRYVMEHKDKALQDQPLHDDWLPKLGVSARQSNPLLAGQMPEPIPSGTTVQGPDGLVSVPVAQPVAQPSNLPGAPGPGPVPLVPGAGEPVGDTGLMQIRNNAVRPPRALPANGWQPPTAGPNASANPSPAQAPPVVGPTPLPESPEGPNTGDNIWQKNYGGMTRDEVGKLTTDPDKLPSTGNYITTLGGQHDPELAIPGQGVNKDKQYPVWKDSQSGLLYTKVGDTGYGHWRYYIQPGIAPVFVQDEIGKDALMKMQAKVIDAGTGDASFTSLPREDQVARYRAAVALDNARKDRNPQYDAQVDSSEKVVDAATDLQQELDKLKTQSDPTGMYARSWIQQRANDLSRTFGTSLPQDWASKIKEMTKDLPGGAVDATQPKLDPLIQSYNILLKAAGMAERHRAGSGSVASTVMPTGDSNVADLGKLGDPDFDNELSKYSQVAKNDLNAIIDHGVANKYNIPQRALLKANAVIAPTSVGQDSQHPYKLLYSDNAKNAEMYNNLPDGAWVINAHGDRKRKGMDGTLIRANHL